MPRTREELERAAAAAEEWLDTLEPSRDRAEDPSDLRRVGLALRAAATSQREIEDAVAAARANGRSWGEIGLVLGISRQAARERYGYSSARAVRQTRNAGSYDPRSLAFGLAVQRTADHRDMYHLVATSGHRGAA